MLWSVADGVSKLPWLHTSSNRFEIQEREPCVVILQASRYSLGTMCDTVSSALLLYIVLTSIVPCAASAPRPTGRQPGLQKVGAGSKQPERKTSPSGRAVLTAHHGDGIASQATRGRQRCC